MAQQPQLLTFAPLAEQMEFWTRMFGTVNYGYLARDVKLSADTGSLLVPRARLAMASGSSFDAWTQVLWERIAAAQTEVKLHAARTDASFACTAATNELVPKSIDSGLDILVVQVRRRSHLLWDATKYQGWKPLGVADILSAMVMAPDLIPQPGRWLACMGSGIDPDPKNEFCPAVAQTEGGELFLDTKARLRLCSPNVTVLYGRTV